MAQEQLIQNLEQFKNQQPQASKFSENHMALLREYIHAALVSSTTLSEPAAETVISDEEARQALQLLTAYCQKLLGESGDYNNENLNQAELIGIVKTALLLRCKRIGLDYIFSPPIADLFYHCLQKEDSFCYSLSESSDAYSRYCSITMILTINKEQFLTFLGHAEKAQAKILANSAPISQRFQEEAEITDVLETVIGDDGDDTAPAYGELTRYVKQRWLATHMTTINTYDSQHPTHRHFYRLLNQHLAAKKNQPQDRLVVDESCTDSAYLLKAWVTKNPNHLTDFWVIKKSGSTTVTCRSKRIKVNAIPNLDSELRQLNENLQSNPVEEKSEEALINPFNALLQHLVDNSWAKWFGINPKTEEACCFFKALNEATSHCQRFELIHKFEFKEITSKNDNEAYQKLVKLQSACQQLGPTAGYWDEFKATRLAVLLDADIKDLTMVEQQLKEKLSEQPESQPAATSSADR